MGKPSAPPAPDYAAAAQGQGQANIDAAIAGANLMQPDTITPYGKVSYSNPTYEKALAEWEAGRPAAPEPGAGLAGLPPGTNLFNLLGGGFASSLMQDPMAAWEASKPSQRDFLGPGQNIAEFGFSPELQGLFDRAFDPTGVPTFQPGDSDEARRRVEDALYRTSTRYMDDRFAKDRSALDSRLLNSGLEMGSELYDSRFRQLGQTQNQAYQDAADRSIVAGGQEASRLFGQDREVFDRLLQSFLLERGLPLQELSQLQGFLPSGAGGAGGAGSIAPAPIFDSINAQHAADLNSYQTEAGMYGSQLGSLSQLGSAGMMLYFLLCAPALKQVRQELPSVLNRLQKVRVTEFAYRPELGFDGVFIGPMADSFAKQFGGDPTKIQLINLLGVQMRAVQELAQEVLELRRRLDGN